MTNNTHLKTLAALGFLVLLMAGIAIGATWERTSFNTYLESLPQCQTEDSTNCYWDGGSNGRGGQFIDLDGKAHTLP